MSERNIFNDVQEFLDRLELPREFIWNLIEEDDWSFVIKMNALLEAATTHALVVRLNSPEIEDELAQIELADSAKGKVKLLRSLGCLGEDQATFIRKLAELRNRLVHNVSNVTFKYEQLIEGLDSNQKAQFVKVFGRCWEDPVNIEGKSVSRNTFTLENPKLSVLFGAIEILACLYLEHELAELRLQTTILTGYKQLVTGK